MPKNITITNVDGLGIADKSNTNPRKKVKLLHEQLFEQYGIDPVKVFERTGLLKHIPPEWISEIIILNVKLCKTPRIYQNDRLNERTICIGFETLEACENFYKEFNLNMSKTINDFITSKKESPQKYNRIVVTETAIDNKQITIRY